MGVLRIPEDRDPSTRAYALAQEDEGDFDYALYQEVRLNDTRVRFPITCLQYNQLRNDIRGLKDKMERATGIEPASSAWKAEVLPMNYARTMVGTTGFEPATSCSQSKRATKLRHVPMFQQRFDIIAQITPALQ